MQLVSNREPGDRVDLGQAVLRGTPPGGGLYVPSDIPVFDDIEALLALSYVERAATVCARWFPEVFPAEVWFDICERAFQIDVPLVSLSSKLHVLELFHGPTLAFKDFGARFMAQVLSHLAKGVGRSITVLTATSGDTGAAVAHALYQVPGVKVCVLYPAGRISPLQEKLFCCLGDNVKTLRVQGSFDDCQGLVKAAFTNRNLVDALSLTSANSINFSRLLAQCFYYFEGLARLKGPESPLVCVPSGNFGNLTAGLYAWKMGLTVKGFVAATNANDVVPAFLRSGVYQSRESVATPSNAMDVGNPSNWSRIRHLFLDDSDLIRQNLRGGWASDAETIQGMKELYSLYGYVADPHTAVAYHVAKQQNTDDAPLLLLSTAHPAKFRGVVENSLGIELSLPPELAAVEHGRLLSEDLAVSSEALSAVLRDQ